MTAKKWFDSDVSLDPLKNKTIAVIGYGIQGRAQANNMKDSGLNVIVGLYKEGKSWKIAEDDGHIVKEVKDASKTADIIHILTPDMEQSSVYKNEIEPDWFGEQVDLCGGAHSLVVNAFETLVEAGYQPEVAYYECLHELKLIVDLIYKYGITGMYNRVSETARYGGLTRGPRIINKEVKENMKHVLKDIQSGEFANEWSNTYKKYGKNSFVRFMNQLEKNQIEIVGSEMREMMRKNGE